MPDDPQRPEDDKPAEPPAPPEDSPAGAQDRFAPDAIAARVNSIGEESDVDRIAREEEQKLLERRGTKKGKKGLEAAASKRLARIGETKVKRPSALSREDQSTDIGLERSKRFTEWVKEHQQTVGAVIAIGLLGGGGLLGWTYFQDRKQGEASAMLAAAIGDEHGRVSDKDDDDDDKKPALYPTFKTASDRRQAALAKYRDVESKFAGTGAAILARLSEGGLLLDQGDAKGAAAAYGDVKGSALAQADVQVRGRALEGIGFADELLAQSDAAARDRHLDDALAAFKQLEAVDTKGFKELGQYHEARVFEAKGDKAQAIKLLTEVHKAVADPAAENAEHPFSYLEAVVEDRLRQLDPTALPPKAPKAPRGGPGAGGPGGPGGPAGQGSPDMNDPRIQDMIRQLQQQAQQGGGAPKGPPSPVPAGPK